MKLRPRINFFRNPQMWYVLPTIVYLPKEYKFGNNVVRFHWLKWGVSIWI